MSVYNESDWNSYTQPFSGGVYPGAQLKLTVEDEPRRRPTNARQLTGSSASTATQAQDLTVLRTGPSASSSTTPVPHLVPQYIYQPSRPFPHFSMSAIPPPPIIFSSPARRPQPMDIDSSMAVPVPPPPPVVIQPPPQMHCCDTGAKTQEVKALLSTFLRDFDRMTTSTFGASTASLASETGTATPRSEVSVEAPPQKPPKPWQTQNATEYLAVPGAYASVGALNVQAHDARDSRHSRSPSPDADGEIIHRGVWCNSCKKTIVGVRHKCMKCQGEWRLSAISYSIYSSYTIDYDLCPVCIEKPQILNAHGPTHVFYDIPTPDTPVHRGIVCDSCEKVIVGSRHKCLDCSDFDLCTPCMDRSRLADMGHNPFHEFYELKEPGRVVVHNVLGSERERPPTPERRSRSPRERAETVTPIPAPEAAPVTMATHSATCDLCDSRIIGDRYKCLACPDFDSCQSCFTITEEQHPHHGFVKVSEPDAVILRDSGHARENARHFAWCNQCKKTIHGVRYKCMHPSCPDFDLCQDCEAHPIDIHPATHPLLKMKTVDTVIPTVYRVGGTTLISDVQQPVPIPSRLPTPEFEQAEVPTSANVATGVPAPFKQAEMAGGAYAPWYISGTAEAPQQLEAINTLPPVIEEDAPITEQLVQPLMTERTNSPAPITVASDTLSYLNTPASMPAPTVSDGAFDFGTDLTSHFAHLLRPTPPAQSEKSLIDSDDPLGPPRSLPTFYQMFSQTNVPAAPVEVMQPVRVVMPMPSPPTVVEPPKTLSPLAQEPLLSTPFTTPIEVSMDDEDIQAPAVKAGPSLAPMLQWLSTAAPSRIPNDAPVSAPLAMPGAMPEDLFTNQVPKSFFSPLTTPLAPSVPEATPEVPTLPTPPPVMPTLVSRGLTAPPAPAPLRASYEADLNIPDGQIFPPGAEFVKSWVIDNDGERCWPETAELRFVAGERMSMENSIVIGAVPAGSKATISTPEMKAPEAPGRYMSYWRLFEGKDGASFGSSIWIE